METIIQKQDKAKKKIIEYMKILKKIWFTLLKINMVVLLFKKL